MTKEIFICIFASLKHLLQIMKVKYTILITKDPSGGYVGKCIQVPAAMSQGETIDELMVNMQDAINLVIGVSTNYIYN